MGEDLLSAFSNLKKKEPTFSPGQLTSVSTAPMTPKPQPAQEESALSAFASRASQRTGSHPALAVTSAAPKPASANDSPLSLFNASSMKSRPAPVPGARSAPEPAQRDFAPREFREESPQRRARVLTDDDVALSGQLDMIYSDKRHKEQQIVAQRQQQNQVRVTSLISSKEREAARPKPVPTSEEARLAHEKELAKKRVLEEWKKRASMMR